MNVTDQIRRLLLIGLVGTLIVSSWSGVVGATLPGESGDPASPDEVLPAVAETSTSKADTNVSGHSTNASSSEAAQTVEATDADRPVMQTTTYVSRHTKDEHVRIRVEVDIPRNIVSMRLSLSQRVRVNQTTNLTKLSNKEYRLNGESRTVSLSGTYRVTEKSNTFDGLEFGETSNWVLLSRPEIGVSWRYRGQSPAYSATLALANGTRGYAGNRMAYIGDAQIETVTQNGQQLRVIVASTVIRFDEKRTRLLNHLGTASERIDVGYRDDGVNVFVVDDPIRGGGLASTTRDSRADDFWINAEAFAGGTQFSEYVHTRQAFALTPRMDWLTEAMDGYYSAALSRDVGLSQTDFREDVVRDARKHASVNLLNPEHNFLADYDKGARVLAALDARIRTQTNGTRSFEDVWAKLNDHEGEITYAEFQSIVETVAGEPQNEWLTRSLTTNDLPSVPRDESLYTVEPTPPAIDDDTSVPTDPDGDGVYEDVNGDGRFNIIDVADFLDHYTDETVQNNADQFNFDGEGGVTILDVNTLLDQVL